jgi:Uma2 family endonuclease
MLVTAASEIEYPESDGKPLAENTRQFEWIQVLSGNLQSLFADRDDVFVSGDQLWYPVEGNNSLCQAPDVYVVFGRPKGHRRSWKQWEENDTPMTVVFEIVSPGNSIPEMIEKFHFYDTHGVEEFYIYDPETNRLSPYIRATATLVIRPFPSRQFVSPRLGIRFDLSGGEMVVYHPDGRRFLTYPELEHARRQLEQAHKQAEERFARLAFLAGRVTTGQATADEITEFQRLIAPPTT